MPAIRKFVGSTWFWGLCGAGLLIALAVQFPETTAFRAGMEWISQAGPLAPALFILFYSVATILFVPGWIPTLAGGALFGFGLGTLWVSAGANLGAFVAFLLSRTILRTWVRRRIEGHPRIQFVDDGLRREGWKFVLLLRLSPLLPFNLLNYALGLTSISWRAYLLGTFIGMLPGTFMYVYAGHAAGSLARLRDPSSYLTVQHAILLASGLASTTLVSLWIARMARRSLERRISIPPSHERKN